ncbi:MAG TPA: uridine diphosphate-N-acetylglucosamine-binding protein YvcK [Candidatus Omnitrophota bacterium]|nr:uridine diphosphate-N-acetylglucosamine-binding protein YvcK [Candidatus Omnitrophota bacterium]HPD84957.1 uridine diphosphate-N-acetylglucosamine-binding protein YvcK [Candidatus Omnitrophota bacterium]HRZ03815.1 uridine diphosphate-N-acetylglucosamine-binding protein YvcK [Candidatus Omnitrophota bacterium]
MPKNLFKWLYPGMRIKRWAFTSLFGVIVVGGGAIAMAQPYPLVSMCGAVIIICGIVLLVYGMGKMIVSLITLFLPERERDLVNILYQRRYLERGPKIVAIGGGHGLSNLLLGLKDYSSNITAIVTVADSGGSSGRLREEFNIVAPGDIRNCLVALADAPALMGQLFQFRFSKDSQLQGHNFGNLFLTAMFQLTGGDFEKAVKESSKVLAIRGRVIPSTVANVHLVAEYMDGSRTEGEADIPKPNLRIKQLFLKPKDAQPTEEAIAAIAASEVIILGPGSLYTSVIPNLIIPGVAEAIRDSSAFKVYVCNVMTQQGETEAYKASEHLNAIIEHTNEGIVNACLVNNAVITSKEMLGRYKTENSYPVDADSETIKKMGYEVVEEDLLGVDDYVRHDSRKLTKALIRLIERSRVIKR